MTPSLALWWPWRNHGCWSTLDFPSVPSGDVVPGFSPRFGFFHVMKMMQPYAAPNHTSWFVPLGGCPRFFRFFLVWVSWDPIAPSPFRWAGRCEIWVVAVYDDGDDGRWWWRNKMWNRETPQRCFSFCGVSFLVRDGSVWIYECGNRDNSSKALEMLGV